ncbi:XRE family transcriptional regulator [Umezawaea sp. Da 62-37]|uniref:XRE family transcriptional regulator n=1 Tax=Umezawaea sp. Da 62-37 TaxID=3075927 RepID=UPI0028F6D0FF|nr:XRE family transcriptional regulator [Umezawaea sp. Da 62-37]WNV89072.1 XRE family transcriptional regulator [Umezawaea sp. Da 62-37]
MTTRTEQWLQVRAHLVAHRHALAARAAAEYPEITKVASTPLLANPGWLPPEPVPLADIGLGWHPDRVFGGVDGTVGPVLPPGAPTYSAAMAAHASPSVFTNRSTYRLLAADLAEPRLDFGTGRYFDGVDVGEASAHEYAARDLGLADALPLRASVGDPCDPARRPVNVAISTLTLRLDRSTGAATFFLHWRDPAKVGHAGGLYQVLPVGVFQAAGDEPWNTGNDFSLWRCVVREFAEELLGESEDHGADRAPVDYAAWPFAARMTAALGTGVRVSYLGMGVDPLTFATDMLTVAVFDAPLFDELFSGLVEDNDEGRVLEGLAFTAANVHRFVHDEPTQAAGAALLALAWEHRWSLLARGQACIRRKHRRVRCIHASLHR